MTRLSPLSSTATRRAYSVAETAVVTAWVIGLFVMALSLGPSGHIAQLLLSCGLYTAIVVSTLAFLKGAETNAIIRANAGSLDEFYRVLDLRRRKLEQMIDPDTHVDTSEPAAEVPNGVGREVYHG
jgi:hypothetical protein